MPRSSDNYYYYHFFFGHEKLPVKGNFASVSAIVRECQILKIGKSPVIVVKGLSK